MRRATLAALAAALMFPSAAVAAPVSFSVTIPLGAHRAHADAPPATPDEAKRERRLRIARYAAQLVDGLVSAAGYRRYERTCLSCIYFAGRGGYVPAASVRATTRDIVGAPSAEINPFVAPFAHGGLPMLLLAGAAYDVVDSRIESRWSVRDRERADAAEIAAHAWGLASWAAENRKLAHGERDAEWCARVAVADERALYRVGQLSAQAALCNANYFRTSAPTQAPPGGYATPPPLAPEPPRH